MKRIVPLMALLALVCVLGGCASAQNTEDGAQSGTQPPAQNETQGAALGNTQDGAKPRFGLGMVSDLSSSKDAEMAQSDITVCALTLDSTGAISDIRIDVLQSKVAFDASGKITTDLKEEQKTKMELGDAYGMGKVAEKGEWDKQARAFMDYCIGKTPEAVITGNTQADVAASCTISIDDFLRAMQKAADSAE